MAIIDFWEGCSIDIDLNKLRALSVPVKGKCFRDPCRSLEVYANMQRGKSSGTFPGNYQNILTIPEDKLIDCFLPRHPGLGCPIGKEIYQPPFVWEDSLPLALAINFTYNTNAFYRILSNLADNNFIPGRRINNLLDKACSILGAVYRANNSFIIRYINNNLNMYILSKIIEYLVGTSVYNPDLQEPLLTSQALDVTLDGLAPFLSLSVKQQMGLALGRGIAFLENQISIGCDSKSSTDQVENQTYRYIENKFAIDDRDLLVDRIKYAQSQDQKIQMCAILDDTSESVIDLLWMQNLLDSYANFHIHLLLNTAQISINFSSSMLETVLQSPYFKSLRENLNTRIFRHDTYCPLISYQANFLSEDAWQVIRKCDFVYVKGLNFFETCQGLHKDAFYSFVVYGPISCLYTGLMNYDAVFAFVPEKSSGYIHNKDHSKIIRLTDIIKNRNQEISIS